ncbi:unnamed protein product [Schistosoma mattheei]|uniref:Uncharacterized protein n=1 Tax=Schistosoma mattheei TaxID=31246 RepID=A0A3P8IA80_9TREM|nr:unnamed protein product [Schistosoma mattheei]
MGYNTNITTNDETQPCDAKKPKSLCDDTNKMLRTLLKSVSELSTKIDKILFLCERLAMGVIDRRTEEMDSDAIHFPLRTHEKLRSLEAALENQKYRDHFLASQALSDVTVSSLFALIRTLSYYWYITNLSHILTRYYTLEMIYLFFRTLSTTLLRLRKVLLLQRNEKLCINV